MRKNMVYIQSGGPTSVINSSLYGAIMEAKKHPEIEHIYGSLYGIEGLLTDNLIDLGQEDQEQLDLLIQTPGSVLGSSRYKLPKDIHDKDYETIVKTCEKHNIGYVFVNGGNDSMDTCMKLSELCEEKGLDIKVIGIPKTVDNDLAETDHSLGFGSAAKYVVNLVKQIIIDAVCYKKGRVYVIEVMGRNAGWLTASVDILPEGIRPDLIYLPENKFDLDDFLARVKTIYEEKQSVMVVASEGIEFPRDLSKVSYDSFGHAQLGGAGADLADIVHDRLGYKIRSIELSIPQRAFSFLASKVDIKEAQKCGALAVKKALKGVTGKMIAIKRVSNNPYKVSYRAVDIKKIANVEQKVPLEWIESPTHLSQDLRDYITPLIQGENKVKMENGVIKSCVLKKVKVN